MKNMKKRVSFYFGLASTKDAAAADTTCVQPSLHQVAGSKEEQFFDSKAWLDSDDEDFHSVYGDNSPPNQVKNYKGGNEGRRLSDLLKVRSFSSESQTSANAAKVVTEINQKTPKSNHKSSVKKHCLPSLIRSLSCTHCKKSQVM